MCVCVCVCVYPVIVQIATEFTCRATKVRSAEFSFWSRPSSLKHTNQNKRFPKRCHNNNNDVFFSVLLLLRSTRPITRNKISWGGGGRLTLCSRLLVHSLSPLPPLSLLLSLSLSFHPPTINRTTESTRSFASDIWKDSSQQNFRFFLMMVCKWFGA